MENVAYYGVADAKIEKSKMTKNQRARGSHISQKSIMNYQKAPEMVQKRIQSIDRKKRRQLSNSLKQQKLGEGVRRHL